MAAPININANLNLNPASINASAKQVQQALGRITGQASEFQKSLDASTARVFAFGATTAIINGVTQSFKALVSSTINVEAKLKEINSILGAGAVEFNKYRNSIFQVAKTTGQSFNTVAEGAAELARQGLGATESAKRLEAALVLTRISGLGAQQSVKALTAAMNGFTSAGLTAEQVVNKIVAVDTAFAVSAQDLAEGFSRAGSTAEDAGVSFNELLGLITAVEQRTARGGAVIGNAFKSIFTRLSRGSTIDKLKELGVAIDANQTGVQKLEALSDALDKISDPTKASAIKELAGGVFQINVVSAALKDIGDEASVFGKATKEAFNATNEATEKNKALNDTLLAQINALTVSVTSFAEKLGGVTFGPLLKNLVSLATGLSDSLDKALDPERGSKFIQGLFKLIGGFLSGPGLAIFTVAFAKIFKTVLTFAKDGFKSVMQMGSATERIKNLEGGIVNLLQKDANLRKTLASTTATQAQKEQAVISAIKKENALLTQQEALVRRIAMQASSRGVRGYSPSGGFAGKRGKRYAAGGEGQMEPNLMSAMMNEARDAPSGATPYVTNFRGKTAVMNTSEMQVRINGREEILREDQIPRFNKGTKPKKKRPIPVQGKYAYLVPQVGVRGALRGKTIDGQEYKGGGKIRGLQKNALKGISDNSEANLEGKVEKTLFGSASDWTKKLKPLGKQASFDDVRRGFKTVRGAKGALRGAIGSAFEVGITKALGYEAAERESTAGDFDVRGGRNLAKIQKLFGINESIADFKATQSEGNQKSFYRKIGKENAAGKVTQAENKKVAQRKAEERDRRKNPSKYNKNGQPKKGYIPELRKSRARYLKTQETQRLSRGSMPNLKVRRFNEGSTDMGMDPMMLLMMAGGLGGTLGGGKSGGDNSGAGMSPLQQYQNNPKPASQYAGSSNINSRMHRARRSIGNSRVGTSARNVGSAAAGFGRSAKGFAARNSGASFRGGLGLGIAGTAIGSQAENVRSATGSDTAAAFTEATGSITQLAAAGAAVAGPLGAAAGGLLGVGKAHLDAAKMNEEAQKVVDQAAIPSGNFLEAGKLRATNIGKGTRESDKLLASAAERTGMKDLDISGEMEAARKEFINAKKNTAGYSKAKEKYVKSMQKANKIIMNVSAVEGALKKIKEAQIKLEKIRLNNVGVKLGEDVASQEKRVEMGQALMVGKDGPFADLINRDLSMAQKTGETARSQAGLLDLKSLLAASEDPAERKALTEEIKEASKDFRDKVVEGAIFMQQKQNEVGKLILANEEARGVLTKQSRDLQFSDAAKAGRGEVFNLDIITEFNKQLKSIRGSDKSDDQKAFDMAELVGLMRGAISGINQGRQDYVKSKLDITGDELAAAGGKVVRGMSGKDQQDYINAGGQGANKEALRINAERLKGLAAQQKNINDQMIEYAKVFNATDTLKAIKKTETALNKVADNFSDYKDASEAIGGVSKKVLDLAATANTAIEAQNIILGVHTKGIADNKKTISDLTNP
ncbi:phage tail tape measure protein [bacterium]|nr:phage tail tape measure protein [bacterium]